MGEFVVEKLMSLSFAFEADDEFWWGITNSALQFLSLSLSFISGDDDSQRNLNY